MKKQLAVILTISATILLSGATLASASGNAADSFLSKINAERASHGEHALVMRSDLAQLARTHSAAMAHSGYIYHSSNLPGDVQGNWTMIGENVGEGPDVNSLDDAFMQSAPHRHNILTAGYNQIGVGVVTAADGTLYVTEIFAQRGATVSRPAPRPVSHPTLHAQPTRQTIVRHTSRGGASVSASSDRPAEETFASLVRMTGLN